MATIHKCLCISSLVKTEKFKSLNELAIHYSFTNWLNQCKSAIFKLAQTAFQKIHIEKSNALLLYRSSKKRLFLLDYDVANFLDCRER